MKVWLPLPGWMSCLCVAAAIIVAVPSAVSAEPRAGMHLSGDEYLALRSSPASDVVTFTVAQSGPNENRSLEVTLGSDFAVETQGHKTTVYDFRFRRVLRVDQSARSFENHSLFAEFDVRWRFLLNHLSTLLIASEVVLQEPLALSRFWVEQDLGVTYPAEMALERLPAPKVSFATQGSRLTADVEGSTVATAEIGAQRFPDERYRSSFAAWLTWSVRMYPAIAIALSQERGFPVSIDLSKRTLQEGIDGTAVSNIRLKLSGFATTPGKLDAVRGFQSLTPSWPPRFPESIAALMVAAAQGTAPGGPRSDASYVEEINQLSGRNDHLDAVLLSLHAILPYDGCQDATLSPALCATAIGALQAAAQDRDARFLFQALGLGRSKRHLEAADALTTLRSPQLTRGHVLENLIANELVEAKRNKQLGENAQWRFDQLHQAFEQAIQADPYNPALYRDFANYLSVATSTLEEHYDTRRTQLPLDLARALPERRMPLMVRQATEREAKIAAEYPALFPQY